MAASDWLERGRRDASGVRGWYAVTYRDGNVSRIEKTVGAGAASSLAAARQDARALLPDDAAPAGTTVVGADTVDLFQSPSLPGRFGQSAETGRLYARYRSVGDGIAGYVVAVGAP
jgi:hypothetical protein